MRLRYHSTLREPIRLEGPNDPIHEMWVEEDLPEGWKACLRIIDEDGRPVVAEVRFVPRTAKAKPGRWSEDPGDVPRGGLSQRRQLRQVHIEAALRLAADAGERVAAASTFPHARYGVREEWMWRSAPGGGRRISDLDLARLASAYVAIANSRHPRPVKELAGLTGMPEGRVRDHLRKAKNRGLYESLAPGQAGGAMTDMGRALLAEEDR